jgi:hypothetical protein
MFANRRIPAGNLVDNRRSVVAGMSLFISGPRNHPRRQPTVTRSGARVPGDAVKDEITALHNRKLS